MSREESGVISPSLICQLTPIINMGYSVNDAKEIFMTQKAHNLTIAEAVKYHSDNLEWLKSF